MFSALCTPLVLTALCRKRILIYSILDALLVVGISVGQVFIVEALFERGSSSRFRV